MRELLIGVDGGGTKTNLVAVDAITGHRVSAATSGSIHTISMGIDIAIENLKKGIAAMQLPPEDRIIALALGDPAIDDSTSSISGDELRSAAESICTHDGICFSKSDIFMAMYAFSGGKPAAFLAAGTGSMGIALTQPYHQKGEHEIIVVGGWGVPTCDPGSGYSIAVQGIQAAIHAFDGIAPETMLCQEVLSFFGIDSPRKLIGLMNTKTISNSQIALFARQVDACANHGDPIAEAILTDAGTILSKYACSLLKKVSEPRIGIYGSVLLHNRTVQEVFKDGVKAVFPTAEICRPSVPPEYGAAMFAADALGIDRRTWL